MTFDPVVDVITKAGGKGSYNYLRICISSDCCNAPLEVSSQTFMEILMWRLGHVGGYCRCDEWRPASASSPTAKSDETELSTTWQL